MPVLKSPNCTWNKHEEPKNDERPQSISVLLTVDLSDVNQAAAEQEGSAHHKESDGVGNRLPRNFTLRQQKLKSKNSKTFLLYEMFLTVPYFTIKRVL